MQTEPLKWNAYYNSLNRVVEYKVVIGGEDYLKENLYSIKVSGGLCPDNAFSIGNACCRKMDITILPKAASIPRMASVDLFVRFNGADGPTDWLPKGKFFIDTRQKSKNMLMLECYDSMLKMEKPFIQHESIPDFPMPMDYAMEVILTRLGLVFENPTTINGNLDIEYPNELTMREVAGYIASANAGNFIITDEGKLRLVIPEIGTPVESISARAFDEKNDVWTISQVTMYYDEEGHVTAGNDTADELIIDNPWATQAMCNNVLNVLGGYIHKPFVCSGAYINPAVELGDTVSIDAFTGIIFNADIRYGANIAMDISSPGETQLDHEYPYEGSYARAIKNRVGLNKPYYGVTISRQSGLRIARTDGLSEAEFNSDVFAMRALDEEDVMRDKIYFDPISGNYIFDGLLSATAIAAVEAEIGNVVSETVITQVIQAQTGVFAEITVDELDTSGKIRKYLSSDTSDINYIRIYGQTIHFIEAVTSGGSHQLTSRNGRGLYWLDDTYTGLTPSVTDYPVMVYNYDEAVKMSMSFENIGGVPSPKLILGLGDGVLPMSAKAEIFKGQTGLELNYYKSNTGGLRRIILEDEGISQKGNTGAIGLRNIAVGPTAPVNPQNNDLWIDTGTGGQ